MEPKVENSNGQQKQIINTNNGGLRKATRKKAKMRLGFSGPSGSGKTYTALLLASGMTSWDKIALIDTENGSADLYAHLGDYNVLPITAPYTPEKYTEAIQLCEKSGIEVIIVDSISHEWEGKGGCLESNEHLARTKYKCNTWSAWNETTPRHQKFIQTLITSSAHIITTVRSKIETVMTEDKKVKKMGMKEITREGYEYELTINFNLDRDGHYATASKDRTGMFINASPFVINAETGKKILEWCEAGENAEIITRIETPIWNEKTIEDTAGECADLKCLTAFYNSLPEEWKAKESTIMVFKNARDKIKNPESFNDQVQDKIMKDIVEEMKTKCTTAVEMEQNIGFYLNKAKTQGLQPDNYDNLQNEMDEVIKIKRMRINRTEIVR